MLALLLVACSNDAALTNKGDVESGLADSALVESGALRIDVSPPDGLGEPELLPQSHFLLNGAREDVALELYPTVVWSGTLSGEVARGWSGAVKVPTTVEPLAATFTASVDGTRLGGTVQSDDTGAFALNLPAYETAYDVTIVPADPDLSPFHWEERTFDRDVREDLELQVGIPVYGRVTDATGRGVPHVPMRVVRTDLALGELVSARFETDETGWYVARVEDVGYYSVEVLGGLTEDDGEPIVVPTLRADVVVEDPDAGAAVYVDLGALTEASAQGYVYDAAGDPVGGVKVRLTAESLGGANGTLVVEDVTRSTGRWGVDLLPGTWTVEVIPPYDLLASPRTYTGIAVEAGDNDLATLRVDSPAVLEGRLEGGVEGTSVQAKQLGYDHNIYPGTVDADGQFTLEVPAGDYLVTFEPPGNIGAITYGAMSTGTFTTVELEPGEPLNGTVSFDEAPVAYAVVQVYDRDTDLLVGRGITDEAGGFAMLVPAVDGSEADTGR